MEFSPINLSPWTIPAAAAAYGILHSLMASIGFKDLLITLIGKPAERYYRLFYSIFSTVTLLPLLALTALIPDKSLYTIPQPWSTLTLGFQVIAAVLLIYSLIQTGAFKFVGLTQALGIENKDTLNTSGLYRYMRHPLYTFSLIFLWLSPTMSRNTLLLYTAFTLYMLIGARFEERKLEKTFGDAYSAYRARTSFFIPFIF
jgi:protein-S-isoprenylcysteine O-methyltransferase Ste14